MTFKNIETSRLSFCSCSLVSQFWPGQFILRVMSGGTFQIFQDGSDKEWYVLVLPFLSCFSIAVQYSLSITEDYYQTTTTFQVVMHLAVDSGFQLPIPVFVSGTWILDSNRQWPGLRIPWAVFRIPKPTIPDSTFKNSPDSGIRTPLHGASW